MSWSTAVDEPTSAPGSAAATWPNDTANDDQVVRLFQSFPADVRPIVRASLLTVLAHPVVGRAYYFARPDRTATAEKSLHGLQAALTRIFTHGLCDPGVNAAIARARRIHEGLDATNGDFVQAVALFAATAFNWLDRYGWRPMRTDERAALLRYFVRIAESLGVDDLPRTEAALMAAAHHREHDASPADHSTAIAQEIRKLLLAENSRVVLAVKQAVFLSTMNPRTVERLGERPSGLLVRCLSTWYFRLQSRLAASRRKGSRLELRDPIGAGEFA